MKKKTRYRLKNNLAAPFWSAFFLCLVGASVSLELFYKSFSRALSKLNEEPVAEITFKYKTAQRKFLERNVWDRLRQHSPVYNGDTIHTANLSEATIWFPDGNVMDLAENTMAQIFVNQDKSLLADLIDGEAFLDSSNSENSIVLSSKGVEVTVDKGASLSAKADKTENAVSVSVISGQVTMGDGNILSKGQTVDVENGKTEAPVLKVFSPRQNSKILYHHDGTENVLFNWNAENLPDGTPVMLTVSTDKNFSKIVSEENIASNSSHSMALDSGTYYWKIYLESGEKVTGKFQVIQSLPPSLIAPVADYDYTFRTRKPAVRFIWSEAPYATSYKLTVADNRDFNNPAVEERISSASAIISSLKEGSWWWRVEPYYTINKKGYADPSKSGKFTITKKGNLVSPKLFVPAANALVNSSADSGLISFSWKANAEAQNYRIIISKNEDLSRPVVSTSINENFYKLDVSEYGIREGKFYWSVTLNDSEGNESELKETRSFYAMNGVPEQHLVEPANSYVVAQSLLQDTKFTWKKNLGEIWTTEIQVSQDSNFRKIIYSEKNNGTSAMLPSLSMGTYWWRLVSTNTENDANLVTNARVFSVVGNLEKPVLISPLGRAVARETVPYEFKWNSVEGADYYKFTVYRISTGEIVHEDNVYDTSLKLDMFNPPHWADKEMYRYEVQAKSLAVAGVSSRRSGNLSEGSFLLIKLRPVEIKAPKKNASIAGLDAIMKPSFAEWSSVDSVSYAQFVLSKVDGKSRIPVLKVPTDGQVSNGRTVAPNKVLLDTKDGLRAGRYEIVVHARTIDGIDISNTEEKNKCYFTILPIEPLEAAEGLIASPEIFNAAYLSDINNPRKITLSWKSVKKANEYELNVYTNERKPKLIVSQKMKETSYTFDFESFTDEQKRMFMKGKFYWTVEALRRIDSDNDGELDKILQTGVESKSYFETDVPSPKKTKTKGANRPYGH